VWEKSVSSRRCQYNIALEVTQTESSKDVLNFLSLNWTNVRKRQHSWNKIIQNMPFFSFFSPLSVELTVWADWLSGETTAIQCAWVLSWHFTTSFNIQWIQGSWQENCCCEPRQIATAKFLKCHASYLLFKVSTQLSLQYSAVHSDSGLYKFSKMLTIAITLWPNKL